MHDDEADDERNRRRSKARSNEPEEDLYATMVYKDNGHEEDEDDDSSLPPLLKRLPKDFGGGAPMDDDDFDEDSGDYGTMIVKTDRSRNRNWSSSTSSPSMGSTWKAKGTPLRQRSPMKRVSSGNDDGDDDDDNDGDGGFSTFVVRSTVRSSERESVSGTVVRRTSGGSGGIGTGSTMERAVASMQGVGEGFGKQKRGSGSLQGDEGRFSLTTKISTSSIPESVTREDPTTKYELLNELGA